MAAAVLDLGILQVGIKAALLVQLLLLLHPKLHRLALFMLSQFAVRSLRLLLLLLILTIVPLLNKRLSLILNHGSHVAILRVVHFRIWHRLLLQLQLILLLLQIIRPCIPLNLLIKSLRIRSLLLLILPQL